MKKRKGKAMPMKIKTKLIIGAAAIAVIASICRYCRTHVNADKCANIYPDTRSYGNTYFEAGHEGR